MRWMIIAVLSGILLSGLTIKHIRHRHWKTLETLFLLNVFWMINAIIPPVLIIPEFISSYFVVRTTLIVSAFFNVALIYSAWRVEKLSSDERGPDRPPSAAIAMKLGVSIVAVVGGMLSPFVWWLTF